MIEPTWHLGISGSKSGPHTWEEIESRRRDGDIPDSALVWQEGMADWLPITEVEKDISVSESGALVTCAVSGRRATQEEMLQYGDVWFLPEYKDQFVQALEEGESPRAVSATYGMYSYKDPSSLGTISRWLIAVVTGLTLLSTITFLIFFPEFLTGDPTAVDVTATFTVIGIGCVNSIIYIATVVYFCCWTYRISANAAVFSGSQLRHSPGWSVGWFFIPFANLVMPFLCMADIAKVTLHPDRGLEAPTPRIVIFWWTGWIAMNVISFIVGLIGNFGLPDMLTVLHIINLPITAGAGWAAWKLIVDLTEAQSPSRLTLT